MQIYICSENRCQQFEQVTATGLVSRFTKMGHGSSDQSTRCTSGQCTHCTSGPCGRVRSSSLARIYSRNGRLLLTCTVPAAGTCLPRSDRSCSLRYLLPPPPRIPAPLNPPPPPPSWDLGPRPPAPLQKRSGVKQLA